MKISATLETFSISIPQLNGRSRTIRVLVPGAYKRFPERRFPVVYLLDGQNVFQAETSYAGDWGLWGLQDKLPYNRQCIMVGIDNGSEKRLSEYLPYHRHDTNAEGELLASFLTEMLKPIIDQKYRTLTDAANTCIAGSSLGGLLSFYVATHWPQVFGKAGVLSPSIWYQKKVLENVPAYQGNKIYAVASKNESKYMAAHMQELYWALNKANYPDSHIRVVLRDRGKHNERFWGREFKALLDWLFVE